MHGSVTLFAVPFQGLVLNPTSMNIPLDYNSVPYKETDFNFEL